MITEGQSIALSVSTFRGSLQDGANFRIGIDLGGTKIEGLALSRDGAEVARRRIKTPKDYPQTLLAIERLILFLEEEASAATGHAGRGSVGVGIPGTLSPATRVVKNSNSTWLNGHSFDKDLEANMGRPIRVMNDANCFALSEATDGAGGGRPWCLASSSGRESAQASWSRVTFWRDTRGSEGSEATIHSPG